MHDREKAVSAMSAATRLELNRQSMVQEWPEFIRRNRHLGKDGLALFLACVSNDVGTIERLLKKRLFAGPVDVNQGASSPGRYMDLTVLRAAIQCADTPVIELLLSHGAQPRGKDFEEAVELGRTDVAQLLLVHGLSLDSEARASALVTAAEHGDTEMLRLLKEQDAKLYAEWLPSLLYTAIRARELDAVELLAEDGAPVDVGALCAAIESAPEMVEYLVASGVEVNGTVNLHRYMRDDVAGTPLHLAVDRHHVENVRVLLAHGANVNARDGQAKTPLGVALQAGHDDLVDMLIAAGCEVQAPEDCRHVFGELKAVDGSFHRMRCLECGFEVRQPHRMEINFCNDFPACDHTCTDDRVCPDCHYF